MVQSGCRGRPARHPAPSCHGLPGAADVGQQPFALAVDEAGGFEAAHRGRLDRPHELVLRDLVDQADLPRNRPSSPLSALPRVPYPNFTRPLRPRERRIHIACRG